MPTALRRSTHWIPGHPSRPARGQLLPGAVVRGHAGRGADGGRTVARQQRGSRRHLDRGARPPARSARGGSADPAGAAGRRAGDGGERRAARGGCRGPHRLARVATTPSDAAAHGHDEGDGKSGRQPLAGAEHADPLVLRHRLRRQRPERGDQLVRPGSARSVPDLEADRPAGPCSARSSSAPTPTTASSSIPSASSCSTSRPTRFRSRWAASTRRSATTTSPTITARGSRRRRRARRCSPPASSRTTTSASSSRARVPSGPAGLEVDRGVRQRAGVDVAHARADPERRRRGQPQGVQPRRRHAARRGLPGFQAGVSWYRDRLHPTGVAPIRGAHDARPTSSTPAHGWELLNEIVVARHVPDGGPARASSHGWYSQSAYRLGNVRPYLRYQSVQGDRDRPDLRRPRPPLRPGRRRPHRARPLRGPQAAARSLAPVGDRHHVARRRGQARLHLLTMRTPARPGTR